MASVVNTISMFSKYLNDVLQHVYILTITYICRDVVRNVSSSFQKSSSVKVQITPTWKGKNIV